MGVKSFMRCICQAHRAIYRISTLKHNRPSCLNAPEFFVEGKILCVEASITQADDKQTKMYSTASLPCNTRTTKASLPSSFSASTMPSQRLIAQRENPPNATQSPMQEEHTLSYTRLDLSTRQPQHPTIPQPTRPVYSPSYEQQRHSSARAPR